jgi:hypothetical protein
LNLPPTPLPSRLECLSQPKILLSLSASQLRGLWLEVQSEIHGAQMEVSLLTARLHRERVKAYSTSMESSVSGRDKEADIYSVDLTTAMHEARGQLQALETERRMYEFALEGLA